MIGTLSSIIGPIPPKCKCMNGTELHRAHEYLLKNITTFSLNRYIKALKNHEHSSGSTYKILKELKLFCENNSFENVNISFSQTKKDECYESMLREIQLIIKSPPLYIYKENDLNNYFKALNDLLQKSSEEDFEKLLNNYINVGAQYRVQQYDMNALENFAQKYYLKLNLKNLSNDFVKLDERLYTSCEVKSNELFHNSIPIDVDKPFSEMVEMMLQHINHDYEILKSLYEAKIKEYEDIDCKILDPTTELISVKVLLEGTPSLKKKMNLDILGRKYLIPPYIYAENIRKLVYRYPITC